MDWSSLLKEHEIYALVLKGSVDIQGLVALSGSDDYEGVYAAWMCAASQNNKDFMDTPKYLGVGRHLFAIAAQRSDELGYDGFITGFAANMELVVHYKKAFDAEHIGMLHPYQIIIGEEAAHHIREVYDYEWTDDEL